MLLRAHKPRPHRGMNIWYSKAGYVERETVHPVERCFAHPPLPGTYKTGSIVFEIQQLLRTGDNHSAQILMGQAIKVDAILKLGHIERHQIVAKVYDPLYENMDQDDFDPFKGCDRAYIDEVAAYSRLVDLQGKCIPKFYGSYSYEAQVPDYDKSRAVRVILLELVPGKPMSELDPTQFSQAQRQHIFRSIVDTETAFYTHNMIHTDIYPRNVMVNNYHLPTSQPRTIILDFEHSYLSRINTVDPTGEKEQKLLPGVPISPLLRWHVVRKTDFIEDDFEGWIDWDWQPWLETCYAATRSSITREMIKIWAHPKVEAEFLPGTEMKT